MLAKELRKEGFTIVFYTNLFIYCLPKNEQVCYDGTTFKLGK